jgi:type II secretory pathway pseudopilin PulG
MVITVIAILALLILPLFRDRVEAARRAAVQDELKSLLTAELLAFADTNEYYRTQDLDNTTLYNDPPIRTDEEIPIAKWNRAFTPEERNKLIAGSNRWKGPYVSLGKFNYLSWDEAVNFAFPEFFWSWTGRGGPIMDLGQASGGWWADPGIPIALDDPEDKILIDPWGTPYLFFGPGRLMEEGGAYMQVETDFGHGAIYSLGPDGLPGDNHPYQTDVPSLLREIGILGAVNSDDYWVFF